jgi:hypothetical protein
MRSVIYSMSVSLDGYIVGPDGAAARLRLIDEFRGRLPALSPRAPVGARATVGHHRLTRPLRADGALDETGDQPVRNREAPVASRS